MRRYRRFKTRYKGVYYIEAKGVVEGRTQRIFYIMYWKKGKLIEEKAGREIEDGMTAAKAARLRTERILGKSLSNAEQREQEKGKEEAETKRLTIEKLWQSYLEHHPIKGIVTDKNRFDLYIKPAFGEKEPQEISSFDIQRFRHDLMRRRAPKTVNNILELLRRIINYGVRVYDLPVPRLRIKIPKVDNLKTEFLTEEELRRLLKAIKEDSHPFAGPMMLLALYTGMRRGEMFRLTWADIDFERGFIRLVNPKGGISQTIPMNSEARKILEGLPRISEFVFPGRNGRQRTDINKAINRIKEKAGLPEDFRPLHGLRHTYASMLASSGQVDLYTLQRLLTHKSPVMTQRYAHLRDETLKRAANLAGKIVTHTVEEKANVITITDRA